MALAKSLKPALRVVAQAAPARSQAPSLFGQRMAAEPAPQAREPVPARPKPVLAPVPRGNLRQYLFQLDATARDATTSQTRGLLTDVTGAEVEHLAQAVARLRVRYLATALDVGNAARGLPTAAEAAQLRQARETYEELNAAFAAIRGAIENGDVALQGGPGGKD